MKCCAPETNGRSHVTYACLPSCSPLNVVLGGNVRFRLEVNTWSHQYVDAAIAMKLPHSEVQAKDLTNLAEKLRLSPHYIPCLSTALQGARNPSCYYQGQARWLRFFSEQSIWLCKIGVVSTVDGFDDLDRRNWVCCDHSVDCGPALKLQIASCFRPRREEIWHVWSLPRCDQNFIVKICIPDLLYCIDWLYGVRVSDTHFAILVHSGLRIWG